jgi:hypothetical protein
MHSLLTNSMELSFLEKSPVTQLVNNSANPNVHYSVHKSPRLVPTLSQINPFYGTLSCLSNYKFRGLSPQANYTD